MFDHYVQSLGGELRNTKSRGEIKSVAEIEASYSSYKDPTFNPRLAVA